jgi:putative transposase
MENQYIRTNTTVSLINYHFVICPRYRRKIFLIPGVEDDFKKLITDECKLLGIKILAMECHVDHAHLFLQCLPTQSPAKIMKRLKGYTSLHIRQDIEKLSQMPTLWTRSYFVSTTENISSDTIMEYVNTQKTR